MDSLRLPGAPNLPSSSSSNEMRDKAKRVWDMLDELSSSDPTAYKHYIEKTLKEGKQWMAPPTPCFAVRSTLQGQSKIKTVYLNVFTWSRLPAAEKTDEPVKLYPLPPIESTHAGEPGILINVAVHPNAIEGVPRAQLIQSIFSLVASENSLSIDDTRYRILDEKVIGNVDEIQQQFVKPMKKQSQSNESTDESFETNFSPSLIKQLTSMSTTAADPPPSSKQEEPSRQQAKQATKPSVLIEELWTIPNFTEEIAANNAALIIRASLPDCERVTDCDVSVLLEEDAVLVECSKLRMRLKLDMKQRKRPTSIDGACSFATQKLTAKFVRKTQQLVLTIPLILEPISKDSNKESS